MSDFRASIRAILDITGIPKDIKRIEDEFKLNLKVNGLDYSETSGISKQMSNIGASAGKKFAESFKNNTGSINTITNNAANTIRHMQDTLRSAKFKNDSISFITKDLQSMNLEINRIHTDINNNRMRLNVSGIDELQRSVTIIKEFNYQTGEITTVAKHIDQEFETSADAAKRFQNEVNSAFSKLQDIQKHMGKYRLKIAGFDEKADAYQIETYKNKLNELKSDYNGLYDVFGKYFSTEQTDELIRGFGQIDDKIDILKSKIADTSLFKETSKEIKQLMAIAKQMDSLKLDINKAELNGGSNEISFLKDKLGVLQNQYRDLLETLYKKLPYDQFSSLIKNVSSAEDILGHFNAKVEDTKQKLAREIDFKIDTGAIESDFNSIQRKFNSLNNAEGVITENFKKLDSAFQVLSSKDENTTIEQKIAAYEEFNRLLPIISKQISNVNFENKQLTKTIPKMASSLKVVTLDNKMSTWLQKNTKASKSLTGQIDGLRNKLITLNSTGRLTESQLNEIEGEFKQIQQEAIRTGQIGKSVGATLTSAFKSIFKYVQISTIIHQLYETGRQLYQNVYNINTEMTELRKVSDETNSTYDKFLSNAGKKAKDLGTSISGLVSSTADFSRLGYDFDESQELARVANIYAVVGDEIESVDEATKSLVSTTAAFGEQVTAIEIIDKFNEIGNKFAISSGGIGEALQRSASSLVAAGNDLDQAIALIAGGNKVVQDPDAVGTAYKTVSMRIRGAKTELEEEGLDVEGMAESVSELRAEIKAISGVDIMIDDDTFKSTFDIMDELSQKWESLKDIEQARIIELIAGKRQGNIISSLMTNFDVAHEALQVSRNADGSAMAEHAKWLESLEAKVAQFKATWEDLSQVLVDDSTFATFIDAGTNILEIITKIVETIGTIPALVTAISLSMSFNNVGELINQFQSLIILRIEHAHKVPNGNMNDTMLKLVA